MKHPQDPLRITERARELGFSTSIGVLHDESGQLSPLSPDEVAVYDRVVAMGQGCTPASTIFSAVPSRDSPMTGTSRAGARYLYVCEDGLVHYCSQQRGTPGTPLMSYSREDIRRVPQRKKSCAPTAPSAACTAPRRWIAFARVSLSPACVAVA